MLNEPQQLTYPIPVNLLPQDIEAKCRSLRNSAERDINQEDESVF